MGRSGGGWTTLILAFPTPPEDMAAGLSECDRDCLAFLATACRPWSAARLRKQLEKQGSIYGEITVKRSLARMKRLGIVFNSRCSPRGYYLPERMPLFRHLLQG
jgi:hypothetical protein